MKRGTNPNSLKNLKPAKKGEIRNPDGSRSFWAKQKRLTNAVREALDEVVEIIDEKTGKKTMSNKGALLVKRIVLDAINKGDTSMIKLIWNYLDGLPPEHVDITTSGSPITPDIDALITKIYGAKRLGRTNTNRN